MSSTLLSEHATSDHRAAALLEAARAKDHDRLKREWSAFESLLVRHMAREELEVLPGYAAEQPDDAREIVDQHTSIRVELRQVRDKVDAGQASAQDVLHAVNAFRMHHAHEETSLYRWIAQHAKD